jgi:hypothetical protein
MQKILRNSGGGCQHHKRERKPWRTPEPKGELFEPIQVQLDKLQGLITSPCGCFLRPSGEGEVPSEPPGTPERQLRPGGPCRDLSRLWDTLHTQRTLCATAVRQPAVGPRWESPQDSLILVFQLALNSRHSTRTRHAVFDRSDKFGQSQVLNNNLRTPAIHWLDGDARKRHRGQSDAAADNFRMLREKLNQPQCRI